MKIGSAVSIEGYLIPEVTGELYILALFVV
jgi:hypothetical protein